MCVIIKCKNGTVVMKAKEQGGLFVFQTVKNKCFNVIRSNNELVKWHNRFGHLNFESLSEMVSKDLVRGLRIKNQQRHFDDQCVTCAKSKICVKNFLA